jgi:hypothetical protein
MKLPDDRELRNRLTAAKCPACERTGARLSKLRNREGWFVCSWCQHAWDPNGERNSELWFRTFRPAATDHVFVKRSRAPSRLRAPDSTTGKAKRIARQCHAAYMRPLARSARRTNSTRLHAEVTVHMRRKARAEQLASCDPVARVRGDGDGEAAIRVGELIATFGAGYTITSRDCRTEVLRRLEEIGRMLRWMTAGVLDDNSSLSRVAFVRDARAATVAAGCRFVTAPDVEADALSDAPAMAELVGVEFAASGSVRSRRLETLESARTDARSRI